MSLLFEVVPLGYGCLWRSGGHPIGIEKGDPAAELSAGGFSGKIKKPTTERVAKRQYGHRTPSHTSRFSVRSTMLLHNLCRYRPPAPPQMILSSDLWALDGIAGPVPSQRSPRDPVSAETPTIRPSTCPRSTVAVNALPSSSPLPYSPSPTPIFYRRHRRSVSPGRLD
ncbi:hypothetical protein Forpe1208_v011995 [Fusarium oxysporum f. sp. rapae]|uniref:Uncharacterized protein n=1 Tax=Fusarium oxysporum f. sp. rapae TaxID=485398 RepID=A0A8J5NNH1_FUSOX|nr:hypothetical protein Forpe1208_v011995 [Fusarium oxysporum f. sp. rapae]